MLLRLGSGLSVEVLQYQNKVSILSTSYRAISISVTFYFHACHPFWSFLALRFCHALWICQEKWLPARGLVCSETMVSPLACISSGELQRACLVFLSWWVVRQMFFSLFFDYGIRQNEKKKISAEMGTLRKIGDVFFILFCSRQTIFSNSVCCL